MNEELELVTTDQLCSDFGISRGFATRFRKNLTTVKKGSKVFVVKDDKYFDRLERKKNYNPIQWKKQNSYA